MNLGDLNKVWEIKALKKPGEEEAKKILERVAKQVQPIMRKHNWRVKLLSEFCPNNPALLGMNVGGGINVKLRLRRPNRDWDFFPFDQILDTMLHELCHNAHGPHNASFYKLWDELRKECEELMAKGITGTGEGFDLPGKRLGGSFRQPSISSLRTTALAAAEKRAKLGSLLPSGPKRLGGDNTIMIALSPIQAAAMAAERRLQDDIWCGSLACEASDDGEGISGELQDLVCKEKSAGSSSICHDSSGHGLDPTSRKRSRETNNNSLFRSSTNDLESNFVDLTMDTEGKSQQSENSFSKSSCQPESSYVGLSGASSSRSTSNHDKKHNIEETAMWECGVCTLLNPPLFPLCGLCSTEKPRDVGSKQKFWYCKFCTLENSVKLDKCSACGQWRYSHGPPTSVRAPYLGT